MRKIFLLFLVGAVSQVYGTQPFSAQQGRQYPHGTAALLPGYPAAVSTGHSEEAIESFTELTKSYKEHVSTHPFYSVVQEAKWEVYESIHRKEEEKRIAEERSAQKPVSPMIALADIELRGRNERPNIGKLTLTNLQVLHSLANSRAKKEASPPEQISLSMEDLVAILTTQQEWAHQLLHRRVRQGVPSIPEKYTKKHVEEAKLLPRFNLLDKGCEPQINGQPNQKMAALIGFAFLNECINYKEMIDLEIHNRFGNAAKHEFPKVWDWIVESQKEKVALPIIPSFQMHSLSSVEAAEASVAAQIQPPQIVQAAVELATA